MSRLTKEQALDLIKNADLKELGVLASKVKKELMGAIDKTAKNTGLSLVLALNYSSRWEITNAMKQISLKIEKNEPIGGYNKI